MHIAKGVARVDLELPKTTQAIRDYIADLERELERTQTRNHRLRQNIRSMQAKLELANLRAAFASYVCQPLLKAVQ